MVDVEPLPSRQGTKGIACRYHWDAAVPWAAEERAMMVATVRASAKVSVAATVRRCKRGGDGRRADCFGKCVDESVASACIVWLLQPS